MLRIVGLVGHHEAQRRSRGGNPGRSTDAINVFFNLTGEVILKNPGHALEVEASRRHVGADEHAALLALSWFDLIKSKVVHLPMFMVHITMQLENVPAEHELLLLLGVLRVSWRRLAVSRLFPSATAIPIVRLHDRFEEIHQLAVAGENDDFLVLMGVQEGEEVEEAILDWNLPEVLDDLLGHAGDEIIDFFLLGVHVGDRLGAFLQALRLAGTLLACLRRIGEPNLNMPLHQSVTQRLDLVIHGSGHEIHFDLIAPVFLLTFCFLAILVTFQKLVRAFLLYQVEALIHLPLEPSIEHAIRLVEDQVLQVVQFQALCVLQVVEEAAWRADQDHAPFAEARLLRLGALAAHERGTHHVVEKLQQFSQLYVDLRGKFASGREDDSHRSGRFSLYLFNVEAVMAQVFDQRHEVSQRLP